MGLCPVHTGREEDTCSICAVQELAAFKATLGAHLQEYRLALGEAIKEKDEAELFLASTLELLSHLSLVSDSARSYIATDPSYKKLIQWFKNH